MVFLEFTACHFQMAIFVMIYSCGTVTFSVLFGLGLVSSVLVRCRPFGLSWLVPFIFLFTAHFTTFT